ncbi:MAG: hypothetical protein AB2421_12150 [Thermotaleaceae bacterium]
MVGGAPFDDREGIFGIHGIAPRINDFDSVDLSILNYVVLRMGQVPGLDGTEAGSISLGEGNPKSQGECQPSPKGGLWTI